MPAGHIHLSEDRVALPAHRKRHTCIVPGSGLRGPPLLREGPTANIYPPEQRYTACCAQLFPDGWYVDSDITMRHLNATGNAECPSFDPGGLGGLKQ